MTVASLVRLAFGDLSPGSAARLVEEHGAEGALAVAMSTATPARRLRLEVPERQRGAELAALGVDLVLRGEPGYPPRLASIAEPPIGLFVHGVLPDLPLVAVVGTRRCTSYGRSLAREYGSAISAAGWGIVSGLARGIDGAAHRGTVESGGAGVAVLGSGIDVMYPPEHASLASELLAAGGAVCTEYPPGARPDGWRFPARNRLIVGLAHAVVVVEAARKGGALITATLAMESGVPVFVVPGDVGRSSAEGSNRLIRDGAHPVLEPEDLIEELSLVIGPPRSHTRVVRVGLAASVPSGGIKVDDLALLVGSEASVVLAEIASAEIAGQVRREGDVVFRV